MRLAAVLLAVSASLSFAATDVTAAAAPVPRSGLRFFQLAGLAADPIKIPPEWDGVWTTTDSVYDCSGVLQETSTDQDTLCSGAVVVEPGEIPFEFECTGTATSTSVDLTCSGSETVIGDCVVTFTYTLRGTRTGDDSFTVLTIETTVTGSDPECAFIPVQCTQYNTHSHRTGPAPPAYCVTPARPATWGEVKIRYR